MQALAHKRTVSDLPPFPPPSLSFQSHPTHTHPTASVRTQHPPDYGHSGLVSSTQHLRPSKAGGEGEVPLGGGPVLEGGLLGRHRGRVGLQPLQLEPSGLPHIPEVRCRACTGCYMVRMMCWCILGPAVCTMYYWVRLALNRVMLESVVGDWR